MRITSKTKNVAVYERLRQEIVKGKLKPGQKIVMRELAKELGLSETPIREAIRRLESEGYLHFTPHLGALVSQLQEKDLVEIYLIRIELEGLVTRLAAPHLTGKDIEFLERKNREMETVMRKGAYENLGGLNREFHLRIYNAAPYPRLYKMICDLWEDFERSQSVFAYVPGRAATSVAEHRALIDALNGKESEKAGRLMRRHKKRTLEALKCYMAQG
jgi:DNA-binding GntR family transcriptional regulator